MQLIGLLKQLALATFAPKLCARCHQEGHWWCTDPAEIEPWPRCLHCRRDWHVPLARCAKPLPLIVFGAYASPSLRRTIRTWKYQGLWAISEDWAAWLAEFGGQFMTHDDILVPVPLHWTRTLSRGYNQAAVLATQIAARSGHPVRQFVKRPVRSRSQALTTREGRMSLGHVFAAEPLSGQPIWIVDDVVTSGTTAHEMIEVIRAAGGTVRGVIAIAYAHSSEVTENQNSKLQ